MLRKITIFSLIISLLAVVSCKKNESKSTEPDFTEFTEIETNMTEWEMGYIIRVGSGLYTIENDTGSAQDQMKWIASLNLGDSIMIGEARKATSQTTEYNVVHVRDTNGREGYVIATQTATAGKLAVVTDDRANLYSTPTAVGATGRMLSRRTVMVYYPETESNGFVEIRAYDPEARENRHGNFIRLTSLSEKQSDIQSSILLQTALSINANNAQNKARKEVLLESAMLDYPDSIFYYEIYDIINLPASQNNQDDD